MAGGRTNQQSYSQASGMKEGDGVQCLFWKGRVHTVDWVEEEGERSVQEDVRSLAWAIWWIEEKPLQWGQGEMGEGDDFKLNHGEG